MVPFEAQLRTLAERKRVADGPSCQRLQAEVEARLVPLIRCVLHRGVGLPGLVQWVRKTLPELGERERTAPAIARRLCDNLLRQYEPSFGRAGAACDTVKSA